jgi:hypothetical protein
MPWFIALAAFWSLLGGGVALVLGPLLKQLRRTTTVDCRDIELPPR